MVGADYSVFSSSGNCIIQHIIFYTLHFHVRVIISYLSKDQRQSEKKTQKKKRRHECKILYEEFPCLKWMNECENEWICLFPLQLFNIQKYHTSKETVKASSFKNIFITCTIHTPRCTSIRGWEYAFKI